MTPHDGPAAVTGGTGFIGRRLVQALLAEGSRVRVLVRDPDALPFSRASRLDTVRGDLDDRWALARLVQGARTVFHLAGYARAWARDPSVYAATNVEGTERLLTAASAGRAGRVVYVSTNLVEGPEDAMLTTYQRSKRAAEAVVQEWVTASGDAVIARPSRVYGPGPLNQANSVTRAIDLYRRGLLRARLADGGARANYVHVDDVVDGLIRAAGSGRCGAAYALGGEDATFPALLAAVAAVTGRTSRTLPLPPTLARAIALGCEGVGALTGIQPLITRPWVALLSRDWPTSSAAAVAELGYAPRPLAEGVRQTVEWLARREAA